ncbi:MAG: hypothetical protein WCA28_19825 [Bradyrhizobium sp.]
MIVNVPRDDFLELNHTVIDAAGGLVVAGGLERADRTIPNKDVAFADDEIVRLDVRGHFQNAGIAGLLRIEPENAAVDLIEHEQVALRVGCQRLWTGQFYVFAGGGDADRRGGSTDRKLPHHGVRGYGGPRK